MKCTHNHNHVAVGKAVILHISIDTDTPLIMELQQGTKSLAGQAGLGNTWEMRVNMRLQRCCNGGRFVQPMRGQNVLPIESADIAGRNAKPILGQRCQWNVLATSVGAECLTKGLMLLAYAAYRTGWQQ